MPQHPYNWGNAHVQLGGVGSVSHAPWVDVNWKRGIPIQEILHLW